ncbi:hypothetical protein LXL04_010873 [Taraxacum kok-saghyz]
MSDPIKQNLHQELSDAVLLGTIQNPDDLNLEGQQEYSDPSVESTSPSSSSSSHSPNTSVNDKNVPEDEGPNT